jgi:hypothetical protein
VRATLHDELMREAGFETKYHRELDRRRATRQRITRGTASFAAALGVLSGTLLLLAHVPRGAFLTLSILTLVGMICSLLVGRKGGD